MSFATRQMSARRDLIELDPDDTTEEPHESRLSAPRPWTRELHKRFRGAKQRKFDHVVAANVRRSRSRVVRACASTTEESSQREAH